ncbi:hypothetical protein [Delftia sp.]|uniref:hypothetical protein n=1 Tax=Delftia sp. TaxID=1886637 RepID=UPI00257E3253|nr:hypothetical protein [Delftia sp.]MPT55023.1 hypothetical protein [Delftia sp.]
MTTAQHFRGTAAEITKRLFPLPRPRKPGPKARRNQRLAIAAAQREVLQACIADIRRKARETPAWAKGLNSAITTIELQLAQIKD